ncbi:AI-2E family transporter [Salinibacterium sp. SYSU T00001]|uniref:AI-2E family transporter n=1 Tax=Homoserinimonas sedimenticola TaxID=2986805 RepID=UPI002235D25A|nr:AI-2E family transporter [Salinibacterium sedimenticola]MCW4386439.1 AI-2E family transporter [Salinibacterium sedimenticola]
MIFGRSKPSPSRDSRASVEEHVPLGVRVAGAWSWRLLAIAGVVALVIFLIIELRVVVVPLMIATLLSALLVPFSQFLQSHGWPRWLAILTALVALVTVVGGLVVLIVLEVRDGLPELQAQSLEAWEEFKDFLLDSPLHLTEAQITEYAAQGWENFQRDSESLVSGAMSLGSSAGHFAAGLLLALFATIILLIDGGSIWRWIVRLFPVSARPAIDGSGRAGWGTLTQFVKVQIFVAAIDAVGIGVGAAILQLPLVVPIAVAVFLGAFVPFVGAIVTGALAVFIALIFKDLVVALIMLGIVLLVQQVESHVLQPLIMGSAVKVHPLAVVLAVAGGGFLAGIPGALFAVPVVATLNVMIGYIARGRWREPGGLVGAEATGRESITEGGADAASRSPRKGRRV